MRPFVPLALTLLLTACGDGDSLLPPDARLPDGGRMVHVTHSARLADLCGEQAFQASPNAQRTAAARARHSGSDRKPKGWALPSACLGASNGQKKGREGRVEE